MKKFFNGFYEALDKFCYVFITIAFGAIVGILGLQLVLRILGHPMMWVEETCRYLFIWLLFVGAARAFARGGHLTVDIFFQKFSDKIKLILLIIYYIMIIAFTAYLFKSGLDLVKYQWDTPMYTLRWFHLGWVDLCVPFGSVLTVIYVLREIYYMITKGVSYFENRGGALG